MLNEFQDALLLILLTFVGGLSGYLIALRRLGAAIKSVPVAPGKSQDNLGVPGRFGPVQSPLPRVKPPKQVADILLVDDSAVARTKLRRLLTQRVLVASRRLLHLTAPSADVTAATSRASSDFGNVPNRQETDMTPRTAKTMLSVLTLSAVLAAPLAAHSQAASAASTASAASAAEKGNKAGKPPVDAAAEKSNVANKKPAKAGAQSGPSSAPQK